jgi:hypothetical protein
LVCWIRSEAVIILALNDPFDDLKVIHQVQEFKSVQAFQTSTKAFKKGLLALKERDLHALFGKPTAKPKDMAMLCSEPRNICLSGLRFADPKKNKDHTDFHAIGNFAGIEVYYGIDGETIVHVQLYLKTNAAFPKLDNVKRLDQRLAWVMSGFQRLTRHFEVRRQKVFQWEIDPEEEKKLLRGFDSPHFEKKLTAWLEWGKQNSLRLKYLPPEGEETPEWSWYDSKGRLVAKAYHGRGYKGSEGKPSDFNLYHPNGRPAREEHGWPDLDMVRWQRPDGKNIRVDGGSVVDGTWRASSWCWYDRDGKEMRVEEDDNGDGIPDWVSQFVSGEANRQRLAVEKSWAIHPELIPKECSVQGQEHNRVPIRKIVVPKDQEQN